MSICPPRRPYPRFRPYRPTPFVLFLTGSACLLAAFRAPVPRARAADPATVERGTDGRAGGNREGQAPAGAGAAASPAPKIDLSNTPLPEWVWGQEPVRDNQGMHFRTTFDSGLSPGHKPRSAVLFATCDNELEVVLNGQRVGRSTEWEKPIVEDVSALLVPGRNVIAVPARNVAGIAGFLLKLQVVLEDGRGVDLVSDASWRASEDVSGSWVAKDFDDSQWGRARVVARYGDKPWGPVGTGALALARGRQATPAEALTVLPGFKIELIHSVERRSEDSWVSMTHDAKGRLIVCGQNAGLFRVTPGKDAESTKVEKLDAPIGHAQGLLFALDSLYVTVNAQDGKGTAGHGSGLYRLPYDEKSDHFGQPVLLKSYLGRYGAMAGGEHGPHAIRLGPDGKLYLPAGNFTALPQGLSPESPVKNYAEDLLLPRNPDGGGHDPNIYAPGGWVCRTDPQGKVWEQVCTGMRNTYDIDFNSDGELFAWDSDMEWDTGTPWYRPTRILQVTSGAEYGWRNGTGKWPDYYPDSLPAVVNTGLGSPTGVTFGTGAKFPARYQRALFGCDWAYGSFYAFHLTPDGAGYRGTFEKVIEGKGFDLTECVVNTDGALYLTTGGRGTQSGLYRLTYVGTEPTDPVKGADDAPNPAAAEARATRRKLEALHGRQDPQTVSLAWPYLNSPDRRLRYAARVAIEWQPLEQWQEKALSEKHPTALVNAVVALVRCANPAAPGNPPTYTNEGKIDPSLEPKVLSALNGLSLSSLSEDQLLEALRAYGLTFIRLGKPEAPVAAQLAARFAPMYPAASYGVNRELSQLLAYLGDGGVVPKSMALLASARTQEEQLHYALAIRFVKDGWTPELRRAYFGWVNYAQSKYHGGNSFRRFLQRIREDAETTLSPREKKDLEKVLAGSDVEAFAAKEAPPRQFVRNWQMQDIAADIEQVTHGRSFGRGKAAYDACQCARCHKFGNEGGGAGPDLTGVGNRFQPADVLESILLPSKVISDQYAATEIITRDKDVFSGTLESEDDQKVVLRLSPLAPNTAAVEKKDIAVRRLSRVSMMPEGLVDTLSRDEILDLIAYLRSGGNAQDKAFRP